MDDELYVNGMSVVSGVVSTIVSMAVAEVDGVAGVGPSRAISSTIRTVLAGKGPMPAASGVDAVVTDDGKLRVSVSCQVFYGYRLVEIAATIRTAVADAVSSQIGVEVAAVDVNIDGVVFNKAKSAS